MTCLSVRCDLQPLGKILCSLNFVARSFGVVIVGLSDAPPVIFVVPLDDLSGATRHGARI
ncbi:hypothetical protein HMPREF9573_02352 [Cutibacterium acnes HL072PA2]|nr:hypothetical protein HMPREF9573_02352 [Cutibacterium acnes HL072PA2]